MTEATSIFGDLDVDRVPDDPFFIEDGSYRWVVTKAGWKTVHPTDGSTPYINANYTATINEEDSPYHGKSVPLSYRVLAGVKTKDMDHADRVKATEAASRHKQFLRGIGLSESDMLELNEESTPHIIVGREFTGEYKLVKNTKGTGGNDYRNINKMRPLEDQEPNNTAEIGSLL